MFSISMKSFMLFYRIAGSSPSKGTSFILSCSFWIAKCIIYVTRLSYSVYNVMWSIWYSNNVPYCLVLDQKNISNLIYISYSVDNHSVIQCYISVASFGAWKKLLCWDECCYREVWIESQKNELRIVCWQLQKMFYIEDETVVMWKSVVTQMKD